MFSQEEKKIIVDAINGGMSIDVISNELGISKEELQQYVDEFSKPKVSETKKMPEPKKRKKAVVKSTTDKRAKQPSIESNTNQVAKTTVAKPKSKNKSDSEPKTDKMHIIREKYNKFYLASNVEAINNLQSKAKEPTEKEIERVNSLIKKVEDLVNNISKKNFKERRECADKILKTLEDYYDIPCTLTQAERMSKLVLNRNLNDLKSFRADRIDDKVRRARIVINRKLAEIVETEAVKTDDYRDILQLEKKITYDMEKNDPSLVSVRFRVQKKSEILQRKNAYTSKFADISDEVKAITRDIIAGNVDIDDIKQRIDNESEVLLAKNPTRGYFSLNKDHYKEQIFMKIGLLLSEQANEFTIDDPDIAIDQLTKLSNNRDFCTNLRTVVNNFLDRSDFEKAKEICSKYVVSRSLDFEEPETSRYARGIKRTVIGAEIGNMVVKQIKNPMIDDNEFIELLESRIEKERVSKNLILLGKSKDGLKSINLNDVWYEEEKKHR